MHIDGYYRLCGAIVTQAIEDYLLPDKDKRVRGNEFPPEEFLFEMGILENFIELFASNLNADYIRRKALEMKKSSDISKMEWYKKNHDERRGEYISRGKAAKKYRNFRKRHKFAIIDEFNPSLRLKSDKEKEDYA